MLKVFSLWKHPIPTFQPWLKLWLLWFLLPSHLTCTLALSKLTFWVESNKLLWLLNGVVAVNIDLAGVVLQNIVELIVPILLGWLLNHSDQTLATHAHVLEH